MYIHVHCTSTKLKIFIYYFAWHSTTINGPRENIAVHVHVPNSVCMCVLHVYVVSLYVHLPQLI